MLHRGRRAITLDLKAAPDLELARRLIGRADGLIEGLRPGVMEKLGLGPEPARRGSIETKAEDVPDDLSAAT